MTRRARSYCPYMARRTASYWGIMDASAWEIMAYFAADARKTMTCYT